MRRLEELRLSLELERRRWPRGRGRYSAKLRREVDAAVVELLADGWSMTQIANGLGLGQWTISRWAKKLGEVAGSGFREVEMMGPSIVDRATLITPAGYRVVGLELGDLELLLRRLG